MRVHPNYASSLIAAIEYDRQLNASVLDTVEKQRAINDSVNLGAESFVPRGVRLRTELLAGSPCRALLYRARDSTESLR